MGLLQTALANAIHVPRGPSTRSAGQVHRHRRHRPAAGCYFRLWLGLLS